MGDLLKTSEKRNENKSDLICVDIWLVVFLLDALKQMEGCPVDDEAKRFVEELNADPKKKG